MGPPARPWWVIGISPIPPRAGPHKPSPSRSSSPDSSAGCVKEKMRHSPRGAFPATFTQPKFIFGFGSHPQVSWGVRREVDPFLSSPPSSRCANIFFFQGIFAPFSSSPVDLVSNPDGLHSLPKQQTAFIRSMHFPSPEKPYLKSLPSRAIDNSFGDRASQVAVHPQWENFPFP